MMRVRLADLPRTADVALERNALMGMLPSRGRIVFDGHDLAESTLEERVMLGLALVPEDRRIFTELSVLDPLSLQLSVPADSTTLNTVAAWCASHGVLPETLSLGQRNLEDVFLELTGREEMA